MKRPALPLTLGAALLYAFLYAPIAVVIVYSFNAARFGAGWADFTTKWYGTMLENSLALAAAKNTLLLGLFSTAVSTVLGTLLGFGLNRFSFPGKGLLTRLLHVPVFIPDIVLAVALLLFYSVVRDWLGFFGLGLTTMVLLTSLSKFRSSRLSCAQDWLAWTRPWRKRPVTSVRMKGRPSATSRSR